MATIGERLLTPEKGWVRYDHTSSFVKYTGTWQTETGSWNSGGTSTYTTTSDATISFSFSGTQLRIIGGMFNDRARATEVYVDGVLRGTINEHTTGSPVAPALVYNLEGLEAGLHTVQIKTVGTKLFLFDAIEVNTQGFLVGQLESPQKGWKRYENSITQFHFHGNWNTETNAAHSGGSAIATSTLGDKVTFQFKGTKIRLISDRNTNRERKSTKITIDGISETVDMYGSPIGKYLSYEKSNLEDVIHNVEIEHISLGGFTTLDAIDIDDKGYLISGVGDQLLEPDTGWIRYDTHDEIDAFKWSSGWSDYTDYRYFKGKTRHANTVNQSASFKFYGTKIRLLGLYHPNRSTNISVTVDGEMKTVSMHSTTEQLSTIWFENLNLPFGEHTVEIKTNDTGYVDIDGIEIDDKGWLVREVGSPLLKPDIGWNRYDFTDSRLLYKGSWSDNTNDKISAVAGDTVSFRFYGTELRVLVNSYNNRSDMQIVVDDLLPEVFKGYHNKSAPQTLAYEITGLQEKVHTVKITHLGTNTFATLDAIDIGDSGSLIANIGQRLSEPELGWKRYEQDDQALSYSGTWVVQTSNTSSGGTAIYAERTGENKVRFDFYGTRLRILGMANSGYHPNLKVVINGVQESYSATIGSQNQGSTLQYEKLGLELKRHSVEISSTVEGYWWYIDAIDIDANGRLLHPDEVAEVNDLEVGKRVRFHYSATSGTVGKFSDLGMETSKFIPVASSASPNGDGYFIMVDTDYRGRKVLLADRNIQNNISWDALNTAGVTSGSGLPLEILEDLVPTMTGQTTNGVTITASAYSANDMPWKAFDNNVLGQERSIWYVNGTEAPVGGHWIKVDFGSQKKINYLSLIGMKISTGYLNNSIKDWQLFGSNDDSTYELLTLGTVPNIEDAKFVYEFINNKSYQYYRLNVLTSHNNYSTTQIAIVEAELAERKHDSTFTFRLPTGGVNATDKDNEWDRYMTDDRIWNNLNHGSWTSTTDQSNAKARVIRGYNGLKNWISGSTDLTTPGRGFRPVLLIESINNRFLVQDGSDVKTYTSSGWETVGTTPPTDEMFLNKGMLDLSACTPFLKELKDKSTLKILVSKPKREPTVAHLTGVPIPRIVKMKNDTSFLGVAKINALTLSGTEKGVLRVAISTDSGATWGAKQKDGSWTTVDVTNPIDFKAKAMTIDDFNSISEWDEKLGQSRNLRCAFYFEQSSSTDETSLDSLTMNVDLLDSWDMAMPGVDYKYGYNRNTNLRVLLLSNGDYKINVGSGGGSGSTLTEVDGGTF
ncbi:discoidin domain-containing protein [Brevibacillus sp. HB1.2]|uniref:discoidin domain-containing protein n=1 Tax=Brevibacillus sp. HB1.2 TaxID=2738807 RepID=UPI0020C5D441|nr:discoidin domain-containing protein [Brevibacillus sp. HB1.2]